MNFLKKIIDVKAWQHATKTAAIIFMAAVALLTALAVINVSEEEMMANASEQMVQAIQADQTNTRKRVTVTYNSFGFIKYLSLSTSGASAMKEAFVGFAGQVYAADDGFMKFVGQMVNYTYRMLGSGENVLHGVKLTLLLTTASMLIGSFLAVFLALGKISKNKIISKISSAYVFFFRGTPLLIQLFVIYFSVPVIFGFSWRGIFAAGDPGKRVQGRVPGGADLVFPLTPPPTAPRSSARPSNPSTKGRARAAKALGMSYGPDHAPHHHPPVHPADDSPAVQRVRDDDQGRIAGVRHLADGHHHDFQNHHDQRGQLSGIPARAYHLPCHYSHFHLPLRQD